MNWLALPGRHTEIAVAPITWAGFVRFARETQRPIPPRTGPATSSVTRVSVEEADAFAAWLAQRDSYDYRLPTLEDFLALTQHNYDQLSANRSVELLQFGSVDDRRSLSEWLHCAPEHSNSRISMRCVAHPSWLRQSGSARTRGALSEGRYPFITFRLVRHKG